MDRVFSSFRNRLSTFFLSALLLFLSGAAWAGPYEDALTGFTADSYEDTGAAIAAVVSSGDPRAETLISALQDGRLSFSAAQKKVFYKDQSGALFDAATGTAVQTSPDDLSDVRLNNRLRGAVNAALGAVSLGSADPVKRLSAAEAVFKSQDVTTLPAVSQALEKETDPKIKKALEEARAAIIVSQGTAPDTDLVDAIGTLSARGDQDALATLAALPATASDAVKGAAAKATESIKGSLALWRGAQNAWYGLSLGSVLLLAAIGLAITFGVMGVINMAHGEMVMLGAYTTFLVQHAIKAVAPGLFDYSLILAVPVAFVVTGAIGIAIERIIIRYLYGRPLETLLATWGLSLILQQAVRSAFGPTNQEVVAPPWMSGAFKVGQMTITYNRMCIILFSLAVLAALMFLLKNTPLGLQMRAVTQNRRMASAMGIRTDLVDALTFGLGSGIAGIAGVALSQIDNVSPNLGQSYIIDSFMVVVFGGVGNLWGTLVGAMTLGIANKFLEPFAGAVLGKILILVFIILFIQRRPRGLFALKGRAVEA